MSSLEEALSVSNHDLDLPFAHDDTRNIATQTFTFVQPYAPHSSANTGYSTELHVIKGGPKFMSDHSGAAEVSLIV